MTSLTVVITTRNRPELFVRAFESVLRQEALPDKIVVVDDASDSPVTVPATVPGVPVELVRFNRRRGLAAARNAGCARANASWIAFLDDDDEWAPSKLNKQMKLIENAVEKVAVVYCGYREVDRSGRTVLLNLPLLRGNIRAAIVAKGLSTIPSSGVYRAAALAAAGGFDEALTTGIDHDIWMSLAVSGYAAEFVNEPLVLHEQGPGPSMTTDSGEREAGIERYCDKWGATMKKWMGMRRGGAFLAAYDLTVTGRLAIHQLTRQASGGGRKLLLRLLKRHPFRFWRHRSLVAALLLGRRAYCLLEQVILRVKTTLRFGRLRRQAVKKAR